ncbi:restriction endonuclease [Amycolatopsis lurida]|uniref:restriction endonuclease n=1 Tax=Amycolatopsis lurida TaxID=31959 RepID=UPI0013012C5B|nr:restriction endonuclease [Amycolatopsis lurida]
MTPRTVSYSNEPATRDVDVHEIVERGMLHPAELEQMLARCREWDDEEIRDVLRCLLVHSGPLGIDIVRLEQGEHSSSPDTEYWRRLRDYQLLDNHRVRQIREHGTDVEWTVPYPWEGITWVLDLLNTSPDSALRVISAYLDCHATVLPDGRLVALCDAAALIRAYYIGLPEDTQERIDLLTGLTPRQFEHVVANLYQRMDYTVTLTREVKDGGIDVLATSDEPGRHEKLSIQCKLSRRTIGVDPVHKHAYVAGEEKCTKAVFVTNSRFSPDVRDEARRDTRLELLDGQHLVLLLNQHFGTNWPLQLERLTTFVELNND